MSDGAGRDGQDEDYHEYVVLDSAGRLQIPPELREELDIGDRVHLEPAEGGVLIRPVSGRGMVRPPAREEEEPGKPEGGKRRGLFGRRKRSG